MDGCQCGWSFAASAEFLRALRVLGFHSLQPTAKPSIAEVAENCRGVCGGRAWSRQFKMVAGLSPHAKTTRAKTLEGQDLSG
jgi:hypothetical protein